MLLLCLLSCHTDKSELSDDDFRESSVQISPPIGGQGIELQVEFDASYSSFSYDNPSLDMGDQK